MKPPTLAEWRAWNQTATRNWTDDLPGVHTAGKRAADADNSAVVTPRPTRTQHRPRRKPQQ